MAHTPDCPDAVHVSPYPTLIALPQAGAQTRVDPTSGAEVVTGVDWGPRTLVYVTASTNVELRLYPAGATAPGTGYIRVFVPGAAVPSVRLRAPAEQTIVNVGVVGPANGCSVAWWLGTA